MRKEIEVKELLKWLENEKFNLTEDKNNFGCGLYEDFEERFSHEISVNNFIEKIICKINSMIIEPKDLLIDGNIAILRNGEVKEITTKINEDNSTYNTAFYLCYNNDNLIYDGYHTTDSRLDIMKIIDKNNNIIWERE